MRSILALAALGLLGALGLAGCGTSFPLPTETRTGRVYSTDNSYQMVATWSGMDGIADVLLTQGPGTQLFLLFQRPGAGTAPRGGVFGYALKARPPVPAPLPGIDFLNLFNPHALCAAGGSVFVLDQGDTTLARDPMSGSVTDLSTYWRVRQYGLLGGDTISTFTDTSMAYVQGVAADPQGRIYVSGSYIVNIADPQDPRILTRAFVFQVRRYLPVTPGSVAPDPRMPGTDKWVRDPNPFVDAGSGVGSVDDPRGLYFAGASVVGGPALFGADLRKNWVQRFSDPGSGAGFRLDAAQDTTFNLPEDVTVDLQGFLYIADTGNQRVLRFDRYGQFLQRVNVEPDAEGLALLRPVAVAADDSLVYVADRAAGKVVRYQRRK